MSPSASDGTLGESRRSLRSPLPFLNAECEFHDLALTPCIMRPCSPGRFFAANELKCLLAHIVLDYDVAFEEGTEYPANKCVMGNFVPPDIDLRFRKRQQ